MNAITGLVRGWAGEGAPSFFLHTLTVPHAYPWSACGILLAVGVLKSLSEHARRKTLLAIATQAPPGTVVAQERGTGGPRMRIQVGGEAASPPERDA